VNIHRQLFPTYGVKRRLVILFLSGFFCARSNYNDLLAHAVYFYILLSYIGRRNREILYLNINIQQLANEKDGRCHWISIIFHTDRVIIKFCSLKPRAKNVFVDSRTKYCTSIILINVTLYHRKFIKEFISI
jgi:hypothetical protein